MGAIAAGTMGGVVAVAIVLGLAWRSFRSKRRASREKIDKPVRGEKAPKVSQIIRPSLAEVDAGPNSVLVESDVRPIQLRAIHELPA